MTRRVVITGMGTINPLSSDLQAYWEGLCAGRSGVGFIEQFDTKLHKVKIAGEIKKSRPREAAGAEDGPDMDRFAQFALVAKLYLAVKDSGLDFSKEDPFRCGVIFGSGIGGLLEFEEQHTRFIEGGPGRISPFVVPKMIVNAASGNISIEFGLSGPNTAVSTACALAAHAIGDAMRAIQMAMPRLSSPAARRPASLPWASAASSRPAPCRPIPTRPPPAGRSTRRPTASCSVRGPAFWWSRIWNTPGSVRPHLRPSCSAAATPPTGA